ncbi:MAG: isoprenylcysteine carboxylmethyltransferase family protein [Parvularculaceae bacterium]|nr:isoprenylcysteine carboxylmethyltransferase family protein [Parvularculaceae bacterium]
MKPIIPPPIILLLFGAAMYAGARYAPTAPFDFPGRTALGAALALIGLATTAVAVGLFRRARTTVNPLAPSNAERLVVGGVYRLTRNPMYLGMLIVLLGLFFLFAEGLNIILPALFVITLTELQIKPEEKALEAKFGEDYRAYKKRVRRWL